VKMAVFWVVAPCSPVEVYWRFRGSCYPWNVGKLLPDYMTLQSRRQPSSRLFWSLQMLNSWHPFGCVFSISGIFCTFSVHLHSAFLVSYYWLHKNTTIDAGIKNYCRNTEIRSLIVYIAYIDWSM
jgi:hypothetical protein